MLWYTVLPSPFEHFSHFRKFAFTAAKAIAIVIAIAETLWQPLVGACLYVFAPFFSYRNAF